MSIFKRKVENRTETSGENADDILLAALMGQSTVSREKALAIPSVTGTINLIANTISSLPIRLYQKVDEEIVEIKGDRRIRLLNDDTGDTLTAPQFWKAVIEDMFFARNGAYIYINKNKNEVQSIHYIESRNISIVHNTDSIFKDFDIYVDGQKYYRHDFLKLFRKTRNGYENISIIKENSLMLSVMYNTLYFEDKTVRKGGVKKGFLKSKTKLSQGSMDLLKEAWNKMYSNENESAMVLNDGLDFQETSSTAVELQLNENKNTNSIEATMIFNVANNMLRGNASVNDKKNFITNCIVPILCEIESSLDRDFLLEKEKEDGYYWAFDTRELTRGDIKERYEAYQIGMKSHFLQPDEIRKLEDLKPIGIDFIELGLDTVMYNPDTREVYTPNTNQTVSIDDLKIQQGKEEKK